MERKNLDLFSVVAMIILCAIWGLQQVSIKFIAYDISPVLQGAIRSVIATIAVYIVIYIKNTPLYLSRSVFKYGALAGLLFGLEFLFVNEGLRYTSAAHISVFIYTSPIFTILIIGYFLPDERLSIRQWVGIVICLIGVLVAFFMGGFHNTTTSLKGDILGLLAGLSLGATTAVIRCTKLAYAPATHILYFQVLGASIMLGIYAVLSNQLIFKFSLFAISNILFQGLIVSFASFLVWFYIIKKYYVSQVGNIGFLTPVFGVLFSILLLEEQLSHIFIIGSFLVLIGILILSLPRKKIVSQEKKE
ncbi:DMT family transporter [Acinetobacter baumannii]|nr:DMT family transporter [Acinetobacter baumannii]